MVAVEVLRSSQWPLLGVGVLDGCAAQLRINQAMRQRPDGRGELMGEAPLKLIRTDPVPLPVPNSRMSTLELRVPLYSRNLERFDSLFSSHTNRP